MNPFFAFLTGAYIFAIFFLADSGAVSQIGRFNPYSLLHIPLFGILTFLIILSVDPGKEPYSPKQLLGSGFLAALVAVVDEIHQTFIPTRDGSAGDVLLDLLGIAVTLLFFHRFFPLLKKRFGWGRK